MQGRKGREMWGEVVREERKKYIKMHEEDQMRTNGTKVRRS